MCSSSTECHRRVWVGTEAAPTLRLRQRRPLLGVGAGQPGIGGLANIRLQLSAAGAIMTAAAAEADR